MPAGGLVTAGVVGLGSTIAGSIAASNAADAAAKAKQDALNQWLSVNVPDPKQQQIELQNYAVTGQLSPAMETAFQQSQTGLNNMALPSTGRSAEVGALTQMQNLAQNGGLDAQALQQSQQAINAANANEQGQRGAIIQNFAARGEGGAGAQLAAELQASQGDANQAAAGGQAAAANAQARALQAMSNASTAGSALNASDYSQAAAAKQAQDAINRFNTSNSQNIANANIGAQNSAQAANLANAQSIANANTGTKNQQEVYNKGLLQQQFNNQAQLAAGKANAYNGVAGQANLNATNTGNMWSGIGQAAAKGAGAIGQYNNSAKPSTPSNDYSGNTVDPNLPSAGLMAEGGEVEAEKDTPESDFEALLHLARKMHKHASS